VHRGSRQVLHGETKGMARARHAQAAGARAIAR